MLFVSNKYDVQANDFGMKIMGHFCRQVHTRYTCGTSFNNFTENNNCNNNTNINTISISSSVEGGNRYVSWPEYLDILKFPLKKVNSDVVAADKDYLRAVIRSHIKKRSLNDTSVSVSGVLRLRQGSLFKKKQANRINNARQRAHNLLNWHLNTGCGII